MIEHGAERYLRDRLDDDEYRAAYEAERQRQEFREKRHSERGHR